MHDGWGVTAGEGEGEGIIGEDSNITLHIRGQQPSFSTSWPTIKGKMCRGGRDGTAGCQVSGLRADQMECLVSDKDKLGEDLPPPHSEPTHGG